MASPSHPSQPGAVAKVYTETIWFSFCTLGFVVFYSLGAIENFCASVRALWTRGTGHFNEPTTAIRAAGDTGQTERR